MRVVFHSIHAPPINLEIEQPSEMDNRLETYTPKHIAELSTRSQVDDKNQNTPTKLIK